MALLTSFWLADLFVFVLSFCAAIYLWFRYQFQHWSKRGFPIPFEPSFPSGHFSGVASRAPMDQIAAEIYRNTEGHKVVGTYLLGNPLALVRDLDVIKNMLVKDFQSFHDRFTVPVDPKKDPLGEHMFLLKGQEWRNLRIKLTPTFTSGKMKLMFPTLVSIGAELVKIVEETLDDEEMDTKDILARYTTDVISSVAFGLETNSLRNPDNDFRKYGKKMGNPGIIQSIMFLLVFTYPKLAAKLPLPMVPQDISDFFVSAVRQNEEYRTKNNVQRNDFFQSLLQLRSLGYVKDADNPELNDEDQQKFTFTQMASQAFVFFFAGFETSAGTMHFALYELALHPDVQRKAQAEIDEQLSLNDGQLTYDSLMSLEYLDRVISETLRKYPAAGIIVRQCNSEYQIPGTNLKFMPGDDIWVPLFGIHRDPNYWPDPERFDPDRFLPEVKKTRPPFAYLPFGDGPRNCIGMRFALMQVKTGLSMVLSKFDVEPTRKTPVPIVFDPKSQVSSPKGNTYLKLTKRST